MRIALAQINPTVGDIAGNVRKILSFVDNAKAQGAQVVIFPELAIVGYPPKDLLLKPQFVSDNLRALKLIASHVHGMDVLVGYVEPNRAPVGRPLYNALAVLRDGKIVSKHFKTLLPTYDVFDESRYFEPGPKEQAVNVVAVGGQQLGISICEDLWNDERMVPRRLYHDNPLAVLASAGADVIINASASPFVVHKNAFRHGLFASQVRQFNKPLIYVNQVGGNDELIFDGNSVVVGADGTILAQAKAFEEDLVVVDLDLSAPAPTPKAKPKHAMPDEPARESSDASLEQIYNALVLGLRDYVRKCGFKSVMLGLSGGIDSALVAALSVHALGKEKVLGIALPSRYSSDHSVTDARALAENLGIPFDVIAIKDAHDVFERTLAGQFTGTEPGLAEENMQARIRGALLMAISNKFNHLLLTTGNKSEVATGYCTLYGDMNGGLAVISDVPKTVVYELCNWINARAGYDVIPRNTINKPPSAELRPDQKDQDSLPEYAILDAILYRYIEEEKGAARIVSEGFDPATVLRVIKLVDRSEYKRRQMATGLKVTSRAFGIGRRMPIAQNYQQQLPEPSDHDKHVQDGTTHGWGYEPELD
ncbi:MAG TPA: NAD+ synthase [Tepidisphaeraceae bacterium]|jgi:NAD+ synthetase|nr:NAD+ synthase [Tepidisphaeraceae bacterium]